MEPSKYLEETEKAAQQLFEGLAFYRQILQEDPRPVFVADVSPDNEDAWRESLARWHKENKATIALSIQKQREYFGYTFSQGTLAGAVLQIAYMGISLFSNNTEVTEACRDFIRPNSKPAKFCIGRQIYDIPIGLIIQAARNQYNHWDEDELRNPAREVFNRIANASGKYTDPAFDVGNPMLQTYSHNVISLLGWRDYEEYATDMSHLLLN